MTYIFDNAAPQAASRLSALTEVFDEATRQFIQDRGLQPGWQCLEVGGGSGTIATWLSTQVGPHGFVLVTDLDPRLMPSPTQPNLEVRRHDILQDSLPPAVFDLAHARLVLSHLHDPDAALARMFGALKPGGWLVAEDFEVQPAGHAEDALSATAQSMRALTATASDQRLGRTLARRLEATGLEAVGTEGRARVLRGRTTGARLLQANYEQLRTRMLAAGLTAEQFAADVAQLNDPRFEMRAPTMWTAWGRRPA